MHLLVRDEMLDNNVTVIFKLRLMSFLQKCLFSHPYLIIAEAVLLTTEIKIGIGRLINERESPKFIPLCVWSQKKKKNQVCTSEGNGCLFCNWLFGKKKNFNRII
jgi:hypothetical protein